MDGYSPSEDSISSVEVVCMGWGEWGYLSQKQVY